MSENIYFEDPEILGERLDKVRNHLTYIREYGNDWAVNFWTVTERILRRRWEEMMRIRNMQTITKTPQVFEMGSAKLNG
jgi:hypothetical protein